MAEQQSAEQLHADAGDAAQQTRAVLAALSDPADELNASVATRHTVGGPALALDTISGGPRRIR